jgi:hypothetical protein
MDGSEVVSKRKVMNDDRQDQRSESGTVAALALLVSLAAFLWFCTRGDILLYGDAVAHLNIARRLTDSRNAGWDQLGTVWLPLPHLLVAPFVAFDAGWRTGIGGSIPSMAAYVLGVVGIFHLVRARTSLASAVLAATVYGLNPSLLYMQATTMTETIFLASVIWSLVYFDEFLRGLFMDSEGVTPTIPAWRAIERCGVCLAAAILTRYDGWIIAFVVGIVAVLAALRWYSLRPSQLEVGRFVRSMFCFLLLLALCPTLWLAHNYKLTGHPMDWFNGPYSAKAIEKRTTEPNSPPYPGKDHMVVAAQYFVKAARMNTGEGVCEKWLILLAAAGVIAAVFQLHRFVAMMLLWIPLGFYAYSVAYGGVPIFVPEWWPFSYYNVRYGLELLPAIAVFVGVIPWMVVRLNRRMLTIAVTSVLFLATIFAYSSSAWCLSRRSRDREWGRKWMIPICYREAFANSRSRLQLERQVSEMLARIPDDATVLMYTSDYVGAIESAGIHFDRIISESTFMAWDSARSAPFAGADYIVAVAGDPVAEAVRINPRGLTKLAIIHTLGKPEVTIYRSSRR